MAQDVVRAVLWRQAHDPAFRAQLLTREATAVLAKYCLTEAERQALRNHDRDRLQAWGMPEALLP